MKMERKVKVILFKKRPVGELTKENFEFQEEDLPSIEDNQIIVESSHFAINAGLRAYMNFLPVGKDVVGHQIARIIESKNPSFPVGKHVALTHGWRSHSIIDPSNFKAHELYVLPDFHGHPLSLGVGYLGMPGNTAYFGLLELCQPKAGETVVVTGAAGAVGSLVGQIAKIKGCKVIGFAGSDDKCKWLEDELKFDKAINYKNGDMAKALKEAAPNGVDCYFDNVGGELSSIIIRQMNLFGRISVCGAISTYNANLEGAKFPDNQPLFVFNQLKMEGFIVTTRWADRWMEGLVQMTEWISQGKIKYHETITSGFDNMPKAFIEMLRGKNTGKAIIKA